MKRVTKIDHTADASSKNRKLRVAAYCRVSTDSDAQLESLEAQRAHYEKYILSRDDWEFAGLYYDEGITGTKKEKRPELMRLMADCAARNIDFVITKSISRFSRNTADCLELVRTLQNLGIPIYFEKENINTHIEDKTRCSMRFIRDDDLKVSFITMLNKLIFGHKFILRPYLKALQSASGDEGLKRIQHLEQMLEQNTEQRETLTKLMAQGYIDQILFNQENNALLAQADGFRADIQAINSSMTGDTSKVMETEKLLHFAERGSMLAEFDDLLFTKFVDSVRVDSRQQVSFVLKCGLTFKERIGE